MNPEGKIVMVDLAARSVKKYSPATGVIESFLGGRGFNSYYLLKYLDMGIKAFDPQNIIIFSPGLLTGTEAYSSSRLHISSLSPLTGFMGSSNVGGYLGAELRACNILSLVITGKAAEPVYLWIKNGRIQIKDASDLWGMKTSEARERIKNRSDQGAKVAVIGPAGENGVLMACIMLDRHAAGRTGMGTVMGSKNLKGIAVKASGKQRFSPSGKVKETLSHYLTKVKNAHAYEEYSKYGDSMAVKLVNDLGAGPVRNYRDVQSDEAESASGESFKDFPRTPSTCYRCPVHCRASLQIARGPHKGFKGERPPYESLANLGPKCGNFDATETIYLHNKCNEWGLDSVEIGGLIAFAMDLYDRGLITEENTDGLDLSWGNPESMEALIDKIAMREGWLGSVLAQGLEKASQSIGGKAEEYAYHVKGLAMTAMDPRGFKAAALGYAVSNRGADYTSVYAVAETNFSPERAIEMFGTDKAADRLQEEGKAKVVRNALSVSAVVDSLGICKIPQLSLLEDYDFQFSAELLSTIMGESVDEEDLFECGERIVTAERLFNIQQGLIKEDDSLPNKFLQEPIKEGASQGSVVNLDTMLNEFYSLMGWSPDGIPTEEKIKELGLAHLYPPRAERTSLDGR